MPNHLSNENSPYLLQHANNPVEWYPYGSEAIGKARAENKPIFLSIGYAACHWCHVMEHESFIDEETAALMNQFFINIKVDREERPDVDAIYMRATVALTGSGGWPMSVFLTPELEPFYAGTYFPPEPRYGMPSFKDLLYSMGMAWHERREEVLNVAIRNNNFLTQEFSASSLRSTAEFHRGSAITPDLDSIFNKLITTHDDRRGGWGNAPKFPQPMVLDFLLRQISQDTEKHSGELEKVLIALRSMARGGMYDLVGGGFCRYSVDSDWLVPHFEKMLHDNAQLALVYLHAFLVTRDPSFDVICRTTLDFILEELTDASGGFYSSLDADSEGIEGKYYTWEFNELAALVGDELDLLRAAYVVEPNGKWEGKIIIRRSLGDERLAAMFDQTTDQIRARLNAIFAGLKKERSKRTRPATDNKVLVLWNALAIRAFAEAGRYLDEPKYIVAAKRSVDHIFDKMITHDELKRSWRAGKAQHMAYLEDHAALAWTLSALYQSDPDPRWYQQAIKHIELCFQYYSDDQGGFFDTHVDSSDLLLRPKDIQDNAIPSGNALIACALLELSAFGDHPEWRDFAESMVRNILPLANEHPTGYGQWLIAASMLDAPNRQLALILPCDGGNIPSQISREWKPNQVTAVLIGEITDSHPSILRDRPMIGGKPTAYVCENFVCDLPTTELGRLF